MAIHYNAFISYRHHPDDIRVASEIHRSLERFHVPRALRKRTGKIERLFRDKEELPITSNLSDDIDLALSNSDYLIVICSVHTKESVWVQREIELFLKTHDRDHVLTVLASGEPYDVIPEILLYEDTVDPVTGETKRIEYEPLSCDWRMKLRKAKQEELPRLAAALLGCGYDELRQRQKQYRTRRLVTITSIAAAASTCLAAYFLYTSITIQRANEQIRAANIQIQENLNEALRNQSRHLATAARERLAEGDRLTALSLAVAALPSEENVRPYVPEGEKVLTEALGIYDTVNRLTAVGTLSPGVNVGIRDFWVTESDAVAYLYDNRGIISAWDTKTLEKLGEFSLGEGYYFGEARTLPDDTILVLAGEYGKSLYCYTPEGKLRWERNDCLDLAWQEDGSLLMIAMKSLTEYALLQLDPESGKVEREVSLPMGESGTTPSSLIVKDQPLGVAVPIRYYTYGTSELYTLDWDTEEIKPLDLGTAYPYDILLEKDGKLFLMGDPEGLGITGNFGSDRVNSPGTCPIRCYDISTGELLWESSITASVTGTHTLEALPEGRLLCQVGNVFQVLDRESGEIIHGCDAGSGVVSLAVEDKCVTAVLQDGYVCYYWYDANYCYEVKFAGNDVSAAWVGMGLYLQHTDGDQVTVFRTRTAEADWVCPIGVEMSPDSQMVRNNLVAYQDRNYVYLFDMQTRELIWAGERSGGQLLGFSEDGSCLYYTMGQDVLVTVDAATAEGRGEALPLGEGERLSANLLLQEDRLYFAANGPQGPMLVAMDVNSGVSKAVSLTRQDESGEVSSLWYVLGAKGDIVWLWNGEGQAVELDLQTEQIRVLAEETTQRPVVVTDPAGDRIAMANNFGITVYGPEGGEMFLSLDGGSAGSLCFREEELLALCDNGFLYRFNLEGQVLSRTKLEVDVLFAEHLISADADPSAVLWQFTPEGKLVINARGTGNVIDCGTWGLTACMTEFLAWDGSTNTLVCSLTDTLAGFPLYTTEELLTLARQELGSFDLTQEQRAAYGIE